MTAEVYALERIIRQKEKKRLSFGEGHLHLSAIACTSYFTSPNDDGLRGINMHAHTHCDDIEILLQGSIACFETKTKAYQLRAPMLIINRPKVPHSLVSLDPEQRTLVLGYRSPSSYEGFRVDANKIDRETNGHQEFISLKDPYEGSKLIVETQFNRVLSHYTKDEGILSIASNPAKERCFVNLSRSSLTLTQGNQNYSLPPKALFVDQKTSQEMTFRSRKAIHVIEYRPLCRERASQ